MCFIEKDSRNKVFFFNDTSGNRLLENCFSNDTEDFFPDDLKVAGTFLIMYFVEEDSRYKVVFFEET